MHLAEPLRLVRSEGVHSPPEPAQLVLELPEVAPGAPARYSVGGFGAGCGLFIISGSSFEPEVLGSTSSELSEESVSESGFSLGGICSKDDSASSCSGSSRSELNSEGKSVSVERSPRNRELSFLVDSCEASSPKESVLSGECSDRRISSCSVRAVLGLTGEAEIG